MSHDKEGKKYTIIIFLVVVAVLIYGWYTSEEHRLALLEELRSNESEYEERIEELKRDIEFWKEEAGY